MARLVETVHYKFKESSKSLSLFFFKMLSGLIMGLTISLAGQTIIGYSNLVFSFVIILVTAIFLRIVRKWNFLMIILFDLFAFVAGLLLKLYIHMAP